MLLKIHLFLQLLMFMLTSISLSSSSYINLTAIDAVNHKNLICGSIPYPFGTAGNAIPGFEIDCLEEEPWIAISISNNTYTIQEISLQGYIKIFAGSIHKSCFNGHKKTWMESEGSGRFNFDGTPFTVSYQYNMLTVVGCNNLVLISTQAENLTATSGCVTFCNPRGTTSLTGSCSGIGCCQATLPGNLKSFDLQFTQVNISNSSVDFDNCIAVYFAQRDDFQYSNQGGYYETSFSDTNLVQLDWAIGNKSCEDSRNDTGFFACKNNSYCYDSPSMVGYLCNCGEGYKGNPYAEDGCTDIDECLELDPCVGRCINLPGNYTCSCPTGMTGDGRKGGSGCKRRMFPLEVALGAGLASFIKDIIYIVILKLVVSFIKDNLF